ncbi:anthocyanidin 3-O-glucosyltransferase 6-like protein [Cinnamomum micranthum f. kanehirae]|uniref:Anthocyanidin 3-O-glucosyltransferase 6-like protein n=1 Tax=Cinnamomum micranthum f. kanehirae TaxID=337451 RepID=A0A3S3LYY5_9MAGN|nr:anthocyanidin 3-O-glucosyltransferase 6-like protein [Cinnamomum micranthum f. kanehirae]
MEKLELLFLPSPGVGHLISTVELARRFHEKRHFSFTILLIPLQSPALPSKIISYVQSITASYPDIRFIYVPLIDLPFETDLNSNTFLSLLMEKYKSNVKETIKKLQSSSSSSSTHITALILDLFATTMIDVGVELGITTYTSTIHRVRLLLASCSISPRYMRRSHVSTGTTIKSLKCPACCRCCQL